MAEKKASQQELLAENFVLRQRLDEAEETLRAIRNGEVDSLIVSTPEGDQIYTLKGADQSYRILVETINEGAAILTPDGDILYANNKLAEILRLPLEQVIGSAIGDYIIETDRDRFGALFAKAKESAGVGEFSLVTDTGGQTPVYLSAGSLKISETPGAVCLAVTDLTQQKRDAVLIAEAKLSQEILSQAEQAIAVCDVMGRIIRGSRGLHLLCEQNPLFLTFPQAFPLRYSSNNQPFSLDPLYQKNFTQNEEMYFFRPDGKQAYLTLNAGPLLGEDQEIKGYVIALTDITERKRAELERQKLIEQLQQSEEELQAANEALLVQADELQESRDILEQRVEERTAEVVAVNERLKYLASQLLTAQEQERKRISMELHDDLGQSLTVLKMQLRQLIKKLEAMPRAQEKCNESLKFVNGIIEKVRRLSRELSPAVLEDLGLSGALDHLFGEFAKYQGLKVSVEKAELRSLFPMEAEISFYRIFQEALNNISKHSGATKVEVAIKKDDQGVEFIIKDNGRGFDVLELENRGGNDWGLGLAAMDERVRILGGELKVSSLKYVGTKITFTIPFSPREQID